MPVTIRNVRTIATAPEGINLLVVVVETSEPGLVGYGCATFAYRHLAVKLVVEEYLKPLLLGRDVSAISELWQLMHQNAYWRNGPIDNNAIAGIDLALWDIKGKMAGMPVYDLLGGKMRAGVPIYRHADGRDAKEVCENIAKYTELGIKNIRCQCQGYGGATSYGPAPLGSAAGASDGVYVDSKRYIRETLDLFSEVRSHFGSSIELCHDVHERVHPADALVFAKKMEEFDLFFLEDSVPLDQMEWLRRIRAASSIPLSIGELFTNPLEWRLPISERLIDFIRVHITQIGGITPARKLQLFADEFGVRTAWHGPGDMSPLAHAANIHIDLSASNFGVQEWSGVEPPNHVIQELHGPQGALLDVFPGLPEMHNGFVYANDKPGLGVNVNEKEAAKYPCSADTTTWTQTRRADGSLVRP